jgi:SAM-dependent methyltransferase
MAFETIYDHPLYYDILFGFDRGPEAAFYDATFTRCEVAPGARVLEVCAGPARVSRLLARRGWNVSALDRSAAMLGFARTASAEEGIRLATFHADMTRFDVERPFAAAFNPLSSFRLLHADVDVDAHLRCVADALAPGGVYVIDLALQADEAAPSATTNEAWEMSRGEVTVRGEDAGVTVCDAGAERHLVWGQEAHLRGYTEASFAARVAGCPDFAVESWHPESGRPTGVSEFEIEGALRPPSEGRTMVVLRRR